MYVIIGSHVVPLEGKCLHIALIIVKITLNVIVRQMLIKCPLNNGMFIVQTLVKIANTSTTFSQQVEITLSKCLRV
jgi:hypothetical protein